MTQLERPVVGVRPGDVLAGKYRVERVLGAGGMGVVVAAHHLLLDETVALKFLLPAALSNADAVGRFAREARAAVKIKSEHVARVIDVGELEGGAPYIVMEYLEGTDLAARLAERGPLPVEDVVSFVLQTCEALSEAHALGIIHRDLKPANLFLANRPSGSPIVKVLDFGISKSALAMSQPQLTKTSAVIGSPLYMSPEQMQSAKSVDVRSDIWALGVVLYELTSATLPFRGETMPELILSVLQREPTPLHELRPEITPDFDAVVRRCLRKNPGERFADVGALALAIAPFGPPGSQVSVDRILHVLRDSYKPPGHSGPPRDVVSPPLLPLAVSPAASTLPRPLLLHDEKERSHARLGPAEAASGGRTTSKPVSSDPMHVVSVPAQTGRWLAPLLGVLVVASGAAGIATWRATLAPKGSAPTQSASPSPSPEAPRGAPTPPAVVGPAPSSAATASPAAASQSASTAPPPSIVTQGRPTPIHPAHAPAAAPMPTIAPVPVPAASRPPVADCDPPYTFNAYGSRVYKKECMK